MRTIEELEELIETKQEELDNFKDNWDFTEQYDNMLDGCYPELFGLLPSRILEECDPIQYRCGYSDYVDSIDESELDNIDEYRELKEELEKLEEELEKLEELEEED